MTQADLERRIRVLEQKVVNLEQGQLMLATAVALARWGVPVVVSVAAIVVIFAK